VDNKYWMVGGKFGILNAKPETENPMLDAGCSLLIAGNRKRN